MQINFQEQLVSFTGEGLKEGDQVITLGLIACNALMNSTEEKMQGDEKVRRFDLATVIYASTEAVDMKVEDVALIKKLIGEMYGPVIVGPTWKMLDK